MLFLNYPPQLYYVLDNLQDDVEDIEDKLKRAVLKDYRPATRLQSLPPCLHYGLRPSSFQGTPTF